MFCGSNVVSRYHPSTSFSVRVQLAAYVWLASEGARADAKLRTSPRLLASHPEYLWLNRLQCLGEYCSSSNAASYGVYAVR
jgi:hypothetical protein